MSSLTIHGSNNDSKFVLNSSGSSITNTNSEALEIIESNLAVTDASLALVESNLAVTDASLALVESNLTVTDASLALVESNLLTSNKDASFNIIKSSITKAQKLFSDQVVPSTQDISYINSISLNDNIITEFTLPDKYYYKDFSQRSRVEVTDQGLNIIEALTNTSHFVHQPIDNENTIRLHSLTPTENHDRSNPLNRPFNYLDSVGIDTATAQINSLINKHTDTSYSSQTNFQNPNPDISFACLCKTDNSNNPTTPSWGPRILNQGQLGDCYAFASAEMISFAYTKFLAEQLNLDLDIYSEDLNSISNYYLPSMIYLEKSFNRLSSLYNSENPFSQGGLPAKCVTSYLSQEACPLEFQYTYPLLLTSFKNFFQLSENGKTYLVNEYIDKVINDTPSDILSNANLMQNFKRLGISDTSSINLDYNMIRVYNANAQDTSASIINKIKDLINNKFPVQCDIKCLAGISGDFYNPTEGYFYQNYAPYTDLKIVGGHAIVIVGYDDTKTITMQYTDISGTQKSPTFTGFFIIQNSWGTNIGINGTGYFYLAYEHINYLLNQPYNYFENSYFGLKFIEKN